MNPRSVLPVVIAALLCGAVGFVLGRSLPPSRAPVAEPSPVPAADDSELVAARAENRELRAALEEERRARAAAAASHAASPAAGAPAPAPEDGEAPPEETRTPEELLRELESIEYELNASPTDAGLLGRYLGAAIRAGEIDRAIARLESIAKEHPDQPDVLTELGQAYLAKTSTITVPMEQGKMAFRGVAQFDRALEIDPDHFAARINRGVTNLHMPDFLNRRDMAIADLEKAVALGEGRGGDDRYAQAYAWLARAYRKAGRAADAEKTVAEGLRLFPADRFLLRVSGER